MPRYKKLPKANWKSDLNRSLHQAAGKLGEAFSRASETVRANKLAFIQIALLVWLVIRVEQLHAMFAAFTDFCRLASMVISAKLSQASAQFHEAIDSILSLFQSDDGA